MDKLLELLNENSQLTISELSAILNISEEDVRFKIEYFENEGIIKKVPPPFGGGNQFGD